MMTERVVKPEQCRCQEHREGEQADEAGDVSLGAQAA